MAEIEWARSGQNVLKCGKWRIVRFPWSEGPHYVLWHADEYRGTFASAEDAKKVALGADATTRA